MWRNNIANSTAIWKSVGFGQRSVSSADCVHDGNAKPTCKHYTTIPFHYQDLFGCQWGIAPGWIWSPMPTTKTPRNARVAPMHAKDEGKATWIWHNMAVKPPKKVNTKPLGSVKQKVVCWTLSEVLHLKKKTDGKKHVMSGLLERRSRQTPANQAAMQTPGLSGNKVRCPQNCVRIIIFHMCSVFRINMANLGVIQCIPYTAYPIVTHIIIHLHSQRMASPPRLILWKFTAQDSIRVFDSIIPGTQEIQMVILSGAVQNNDWPPKRSPKNGLKNTMWHWTIIHTHTHIYHIYIYMCSKSIHTLHIYIL